MTDTVRTHVVLSRELVEAVDAIVGSRRRSQYVEQAVAERLSRDRQLRALHELQETGGVLAPEEYPHWSSPEKTSNWVRRLRREADERTTEKLAGGSDDDAASP